LSELEKKLQLMEERMKEKLSSPKDAKLMSTLLENSNQKKLSTQVSG